MIHDCLIPALKREFSGWEIVFSNPPQPIATFPAAQAAVGKVLVYDDGDEATILIENITHAHFSPHDTTLEEADRQERITEDVIDFLKALFSDRVLLHTSADHRSGGWARLDLKEGATELSSSSRYYFWSKPYVP